MFKVNKFTDECIFFFVSWYFLKEMKHMLSLFLLSYRNMSESLRELEKALNSISRFPKLSLMFLQLDRNTVHVFYFLNINK